MGKAIRSVVGLILALSLSSVHSKVVPGNKGGNQLSGRTELAGKLEKADQLRALAKKHLGSI
jgi:hypothetical protein